VGERVLIDPERNDAVETAVGRDQCITVIDHGLMGATPADPERPGRLLDGVEVLADTPTDLGSCPLGQRRPRPISSDVSDHDPRRHIVSLQRHVRLDHTITVGTPAIGRSRTGTRRRPLPTARTPQSGHHDRGASVSTSSQRSPS
jgi:hypothetical protein